MEWDEDAIGQLTALWAEGHSTAEIGRRLGVSKNAVVGKAHRLNLLARPSPIRRSEAGVALRATVARRPVGSLLASFASASPASPAPDMAATVTLVHPPQEAAREDGSTDSRDLSPRRAAPAAVPSPPRAEKPAPMLRHVPPARTSRITTCCWPIGEPGKPSFRFCDGDAMTGKPYCQKHAELAYVKVRDRREEAA